MTLRPYQQQALDASINWMRSSIDPFLVEAATGAGKSHIIAAVAEHIHGMTGKRVLCLAPSAELVTQNRAKFLATGNPCSVFSASAGGKDLRHPVVFGSPLTVKNRISAFRNNYAMVVIDECHGTTPTLRGIVDEMRKGNPRLRVMGLTATPYRLGSGYIFREWPDGRVNGDDTSRDPYFTKCVHRICGRELIEQGYLTPPIVGAINAEGYDTSWMVLNSRGQFDAADIDRAYHGHGRKTAAIVADIVAQSRDRNGVLIFAATVRHAQEVLASLPPEISAIVTGETPAAERKSLLKRFLARDLKYLVNVAVLTTGFDAPHVDVVAILRKTESVGLLQQIVGRGLRLCDGKRDALILDYTSNIDDHCPDGDLFAPEIRAGRAPGSSRIEVKCPLCKTVNEVAVRPEIAEQYGGEEIPRDEAGYLLDLDGNRVETEHGPMPMHMGRRCWGMVRTGALGEHVRCSYRWTSKDCPQCSEPNDIAARYCIECKAELVDPNEKLLGDFRALKRDPSRLQCDEVLGMETRPGISQRGNKTLRVDFTTPYRSFSIWLQPEGTHSRAIRDYAAFQAATNNGVDAPETVSYIKEASGFYRVLAYDQPADAAPEGAETGVIYETV